MLKEQRLWEKFIPDMSIINIHNGKEANAEKKKERKQKGLSINRLINEVMPQVLINRFFFQDPGKIFFLQ